MPSPRTDTPLRDINLDLHDLGLFRAIGLSPSALLATRHPDRLLADLVDDAAMKIIVTLHPDKLDNNLARESSEVIDELRHKAAELRTACQDTTRFGTMLRRAANAEKDGTLPGLIAQKLADQIRATQGLSKALLNYQVLSATSDSPTNVRRPEVENLHIVIEPLHFRSEPAQVKALLALPLSAESFPARSREKMNPGVLLPKRAQRFAKDHNLSSFSFDKARGAWTLDEGEGPRLCHHQPFGFFSVVEAHGQLRGARKFIKGGDALNHDLKHPELAQAFLSYTLAREDNLAPGGIILGFDPRAMDARQMSLLMSSITPDHDKSDHSYLVTSFKYPVGEHGVHEARFAMLGRVRGLYAGAKKILEFDV